VNSENGRRRWEDNIKADLKETEYEDVDRIYLAQDTVQWWVLVHSNEPSASIKAEEIS
jgi:hypothetical protein